MPKVGVRQLPIAWVCWVCPWWGEALSMAALEYRVKVVVSVGGQLAWEEVFRKNAWGNIFGGLGLGRKLIRLGSGGEDALKAFREAYPG